MAVRGFMYFARQEAVQSAIDYCIDNDILADMLVKQKAEVVHMLLTEYNKRVSILNGKKPVLITRKKRYCSLKK